MAGHQGKCVDPKYASNAREYVRDDDGYCGCATLIQHLMDENVSVQKCKHMYFSNICSV